MPANVQGATPAGTAISNTAQLAFDLAGVLQSTSSNTVSLTVGESLDVAIKAQSETTPLPGTAGTTCVPFHVVSLGNGPEAFTVTTETDNQGATVHGIALDQNSNGIYEPDRESLLAAGALTLAAGQEASLCVIVDGALANSTSRTVVSASIKANTGAGEPGTVFPGGGPNGGDAVVGKTGALAKAQTILVGGTDQPILAKSQSVRAPDGSASPVRNAIITYQLEARFPNATQAVEIADLVPEGTTYVPGSITLDGALLSDAVDADSGQFDGTAVRIALGNATAGQARIVRFQVTIQ